MSKYVLLRHRDIPNIKDLKVYQEQGGFESFKKAVTTLEPVQVTDIIKASGLRGRGGAGFPTGLKWSFMDQSNWPHYVIANADESEPGTFKDREIIEENPLQFLEGVAIGSYAVGATAAYIYLRGEFWQLAEFLDTKISELEKAGLLGEKLFGTDYSLIIHTHLGAGAYICGEETALLESLEGKRGEPRLRPPFPPSFGLYGKPTVVNNVETFTNIPRIMERGADWYRELGTEDSAGVKVFSLSGRVKKPGNYEMPFGSTYRELIFTHGGGILNNAQIKAILPAGASSAILRATDKVLDTPLEYASIRKLGSDVGSGSVIVIDETVSMDWVIKKTIDFFKHESCGKCTPCREGNYWMSHLTRQIASGEKNEEQIQLLYDVAKNIQGKCLCALGEFSIMGVLTSIERFPEDFGREPKGPDKG
ncbi:MAG: NADH-quinone oxidoreductase subunit NuoF [Anaerolineales bacterium]|nr:NADH-quinone oxidoreductase subunit NuoF [Anaerolineales bacterium]